MWSWICCGFGVNTKACPPYVLECLRSQVGRVGLVLLTGLKGERQQCSIVTNNNKQWALFNEGLSRVES